MLLPGQAWATWIEQYRTYRTRRGLYILPVTSDDKIEKVDTK